MKREEALERIQNKYDVKFVELFNICKVFFPNHHVRGDHHIFKTPWQGPPWINIQRQGKMAKPYQVSAVAQALEKLETIS